MKNNHNKTYYSKTCYYAILKESNFSPSEKKKCLLRAIKKLKLYKSYKLHKCRKSLP